ncbi:redoxin domain-containing protein [Candidatus Woesearchaeota archaeon]|nr:redoxin domain-containing protein [Candidatus Woesearchaeota archaeon]
METEQKVQINASAPLFDAKAYYNNTEIKVKLKDYRGKWVILFFYPADFTFICPTELGDLADHYAEIKQLDTEVLSISTDTIFVHKAWHDHSETIKKIKFPMVADPTGNISRAYNTYIPEEGLSLRGTFIIDPEGILRCYEINANNIGRNTPELIRKLHAAQFVYKHDTEVCPVNWQPGSKTLKPNLELVGKL